MTWKRDTIMNINGPAEVSLPQGWPDAETIERLANQLFEALPSATATIPSTASLDPLNPMGGTPAPAIELPGEAELRALLELALPAGGAAPVAASAPYYFLEYAPSNPREADRKSTRLNSSHLG